MAAHDWIGKRGEIMACERLMDFCGRAYPFFDTHPLGEKCRTFDLLVELVRPTSPPAYFLAQVKTTTKPPRKRTGRLPIEVTKQDADVIAGCPFPAYLIGVSLPAASAFVVSLSGRSPGPVSAIPTVFPLARDGLARLWDEVDFRWRQLGRVAMMESVFAIGEAS